MRWIWNGVWAYKSEKSIPSSSNQSKKNRDPALGFGDFPNLRSIDLADNNVSSLKPLAKMPSTQKVSFRITGTALVALENLRRTGLDFEKFDSMGCHPQERIIAELIGLGVLPRYYIEMQNLDIMLVPKPASQKYMKK